MSSRIARGFALPIALMLATAIALVAADAISGASTATTLALRARLRQRAFDAAETGVARTLAALDAGESPSASHTMALGDGDASGERARVDVRLDLVDALPEGFSAGVVSAQRYTVTSEGRVDAGTSLVVEAGVTRLVLQ
jgi:hypothetical protein